MNTLPCRRRNGGFTLVELLVVMAIIAILASVILVGGSQAINAAKRAKANNTATQLQTSIMSYYTEYGTYPIPASLATSAQDEILGATLTTYDSNQGNLIWALCGNVNPSNANAQASTVSNTRGIVFLTPKQNEVDGNGCVVTPFSSGGVYYYYAIAMDGDYDGICGDSGSASGNLPNFAGWTTGMAAPSPLSKGVTQGVAVWACCDTKELGNPSASIAPAFWVHTY